MPAPRLFLAAGCMLLALSACQSVPAGAEGPGTHYRVARSHDGFNGTQSLRFGRYRVDMRFDASSLAKDNLKRGLIGGLLGCDTSGCGLPRGPQSMPLDFRFAGPVGEADGLCRAEAPGMRCALGETRMQFEDAGFGLGHWRAQTAFGELRVVAQDVEAHGQRRIEWRVLDRNDQALAVVSDTIGSNEERSPSFSVWLADGHPDDHQPLAQVVATVLAYAWHASGG